jgi:hypothetical protein
MSHALRERELLDQIAALKDLLAAERRVVQEKTHHADQCDRKLEDIRKELVSLKEKRKDELRRQRDRGPSASPRERRPAEDLSKRFDHQGDMCHRLQ